MTLSNDLDIQATIMSDVDKYTGVKGHHMPRYDKYPYPQRLSVLNETLKIHTLREIGDIGRYLDLQAQIIALGAPTPPLYAMMQWLHAEMNSIKEAPVENAVVISMLAFGKPYLQKLVDYNLKSLMALGNLPVLAKEKKAIIYIQTDAAGREFVDSAAITARAKALGVEFVYAIIPDAIMAEMRNPDIIYWLLGAGASLGLHYAKAKHAVFHHSFPDMVYSDRFFSELLRLSKDHMAILSPGMRATEDLMIPALTPYETAESLCVPSPDLLAHHMNCLHLVAWPYVVNNRPHAWEYPLNHVMIWESPECLYINSPHLNALWLDYSVIKDLPPRFYWTLDSEMDMICKGENFYIPQECDELYQAELSAPERQSVTDLYSDAVTCSKSLWSAVSHRDLVKFFMRGMQTRLNPEIRRCSNAMPEGQIASEMNFLFNNIIATDPYTCSDLLVDRTHEGRIYG